MKRMEHEEVTVSVTPMLDMAFQLLTFFILTNRPAPVEGQFSMNLLPPAPAVDMNAAAPSEPNRGPADVPAPLKTMTTGLYAQPGGALERITFGELEFRGPNQLSDLRAKLKEFVAQRELPFDQALIRTDPNLSYSELMQVIDVFAGPEVNITKISFAELDEGPGGGGPAL